MKISSNILWVVQFRTKNSKPGIWRVGYDVTASGLTYPVRMRRKDADAMVSYYRSIYKASGNKHGYRFRVVKFIQSS